MGFDGCSDLQLMLIREQHPIVSDLRDAGYHLDFLFVPPTRCLDEKSTTVLEKHLERRYSAETLRLIRELLLMRSPRRA